MAYLLLMGFLVSFLGQLPLGNMSFTSTQIGLQEGFTKAWQFASGVAIVEMIYLRFALTGMEWVVAHQILFQLLGWLTIIMFLIFGILGMLIVICALRDRPPKMAAMVNAAIKKRLLFII